MALEKSLMVPLRFSHTDACRAENLADVNSPTMRSISQVLHHAAILGLKELESQLELPPAGLIKVYQEAMTWTDGSNSVEDDVMVSPEFPQREGEERMVDIAKLPGEIVRILSPFEPYFYYAKKHPTGKSTCHVVRWKRLVEVHVEE